jgi:hypothetical protein
MNKSHSWLNFFAVSLSNPHLLYHLQGNMNHVRLRTRIAKETRKKDKMKFQLDFQQAPMINCVEKPSKNLKAKDEKEDTKLHLKS